jgi:hypothetical protein
MLSVMVEIGVALEDLADCLGYDGAIVLGDFELLMCVKEILLADGALLDKNCSILILHFKKGSRILKS